MSTLEQVLFHSPWIPYNNKFIQSRITLTYPENIIFTAQLLKRVVGLDVYQKYPYAEKMNPSDFAKVDWSKAIIVIDSNLQLVFAPDPVHRLVRLDRRLHYREASATVFGPFRFFPFFEVFRYQWLGLFLIFFFYGLSWLVSKRYTGRSVALSSKPSNDSEEPGP